MIDSIPPLNTGITFNNVYQTSIAVKSTDLAVVDTVSGLHATPYYVQLSTDNVAWGNYDSGWMTDTSFTGLVPGTTYWVRYKSRDGLLNESGYTGSTSVMTLSKEPVPASVVWQNVATNNIRVNWDSNGNPVGTIYNVRRSTFPGFDGTVNTLTTSTTYQDFSSLSLNTAYWFQVRAVNSTGVPTWWVNIGTKTTLANKPVNTQFTGVFMTSITIQWSENSNPGTTRWGIVRSTDNFVSNNIVIKTVTDNYVLTSLTDAGLAMVTTYYYKVNAYNGENIAADYDTVVAVKTGGELSSVPSGFTGVATSTRSIRWSWSDTFNTESEYRVYSDTDGLVCVLPANSGEWVEQGLVPNIGYSRYLKVVNASGLSNATATKRVYTMAELPSTVNVSSTTRHDMVLNLGLNNVTVFRVVVSTDNVNWTVYAASVTPADLKIEGLKPGTTYTFAVWPYNGDYVISQSSTVFSVVTKPADAPVQNSQNVEIPATESETVDGVTLVTKITLPIGSVLAEVYADVNTDPINNPAEVDPADIIVANGKIGSQNRLVMLLNSISEFNVYYATGTRCTQFNVNITIEIPYPDTNNDGFVDGTTPPLSAAALKGYVLDEVNNEWAEVGGTVDPVAKKVVITVNHLSVYALAGKLSAATDLARTIVYPNPYKETNGVTGMTFDRLTAHAGIKIFTITGEFVVELVESDGDGKYVWDTTNSSGGKVASGVYLYRITNLDNPGQTVNGKFAVVR
jgi:hypothetical protein